MIKNWRSPEIITALSLFKQENIKQVIISQSLEDFVDMVKKDQGRSTPQIQFGKYDHTR